MSRVHSSGARQGLSGLDMASKSAVVVLCVYETVAIITGRVPTVTSLCRRRRLVEIGLLGLLLAHLHHKLAELDEALDQMHDVWDDCDCPD